MADGEGFKRAGIRDFRDLEVWQRAMRLNDMVTQLTRTLPQADRMVFEVQMRRAALSIAANIAEGEQRHHLGDYLHHLSFARGSTGELRTHILALRKSGFDAAPGVAEAEAMADIVGRMLTVMSQNLRRRWVSRGVAGVR